MPLLLKPYIDVEDFINVLTEILSFSLNIAYIISLFSITIVQIRIHSHSPLYYIFPSKQIGLV